MTEFDAAPEQSPLSQTIERDGKSVHIDIYDDGDGGWLLEAVDEYGNSTVWDAHFASDQAALDEALRTIDQEGIDTLIGPPADAQPTRNLHQALSDAELNALDEFLADEAIQSTSMDVATLEGFLTAIVIGPCFVPPSDWLPWVWDMDEGEAEPDFASAAQVEAILALIMRHYNALIQTFSTDPAAFEAVFWRGAQWGAAEWSEGFLLGFMFNDEAWSLLAVGQPKWFTAFLRLGTDDGIALTASAEDAEIWMNAIEPSLIQIHDYWRSYRQQMPTGQAPADLYANRPTESVPIVRDGPKIGRNDPCPCGSGKKFKKCCGAGGAPSTLQ